MSVAILESTRICNDCGIEKPLNEFRLIQRWHLRVCKQCQYMQHRDEYIKYSADYYKKLKIFNLENYGTACSPQQLQTMREYHYKHWKEYYQQHKEERKKLTREYYNQHRDENMRLYGRPILPHHSEQNRLRTLKISTDNKLLYGTTKTPHHLSQQKQNYLDKRKHALELYGNRCECCGESRYDMLTFDHKIKTFYKNKVRGVGLVYEVIREYEMSGYPNTKYQILCWNCNTARGYYGACPHENQMGNGDYKTRRSWASKLEMIKAYGGECVLCGERIPEFLMIDHINGGGSKHREIVGTGYRFRLWLRRQGWPGNGFRLLCACCNCSEKQNRWTIERAQKEASNG